MSKTCITCGIEIDPRRIAILPFTQTCTQHSTAEKKAALTVQMGEGDHTWTETFIVEREVVRKIEAIEKDFKNQLKEDDKLKLSPIDEDDKSLSIDDFNFDEEKEELDFEEDIENLNLEDEEQ
jgi:hypothetical protein